MNIVRVHQPGSRVRMLSTHLEEEAGSRRARRGEALHPEHEALRAAEALLRPPDRSSLQRHAPDLKQEAVLKATAVRSPLRQ